MTMMMMSNVWRMAAAEAMVANGIAGGISCLYCAIWELACT